MVFLFIYINSFRVRWTNQERTKYICPRANDCTFKISLFRSRSKKADLINKKKYVHSTQWILDHSCGCRVADDNESLLNNNDYSTGRDTEPQVAEVGLYSLQSSETRLCGVA